MWGTEPTLILSLAYSACVIQFRSEVCDVRLGDGSKEKKKRPFNQRHLSRNLTGLTMRVLSNFFLFTEASSVGTWNTFYVSGSPNSSFMLKYIFF